ncbi:hypothetical protein Dcar01_03694 [Deinococcus carri]|uniref:JAB domain-containing protein n=1 Tax=Deinococcus carri TaxID=1211323 RepID=A0ABP9WDX6_9DEIO
MPVNTIELPQGLRDTLDAFILADPGREHGGFLFGTPLRFDTFLPVPNVSARPQREYKVPDNWQDYVNVFACVTGNVPIAHVHTHPSHSIPSEQDFRAGQYWYRLVRYMVLIAPNASGNKTTWWVLDRNAEVQELLHVDRELEASSLLVARRYGFAALGQVLLDQQGSLRGPSATAQVLLENSQARQLYARLLAQGPVRTKAELAKVAGLPAERAQALAKALEAAGLVEIKVLRYGERGTEYRAVSLFAGGGV